MQRLFICHKFLINYLKLLKRRIYLCLSCFFQRKLKVYNIYPSQIKFLSTNPKMLFWKLDRSKTFLFISGCYIWHIVWITEIPSSFWLKYKLESNIHWTLQLFKLYLMPWHLSEWYIFITNFWRKEKID